MILKILFYLTFFFGFLSNSFLFFHIGIDWYPFRIFLVILTFAVILYSLINLSHFIKTFGEFIYYSAFFFIWLLYSFLSLIWVEDFKYAKTEIASLISINIFIFSSFFIIKDEKNIKNLIRIWLLVFISSTIVAIWEILTAHHLPNSAFSKSYAISDPWVRFEMSYVENKIYLPTSFFGHPNQFSAFLVASLAIILFYFKNIFVKIIAFVIVSAIIAFTTSRTGIIGLFSIYILTFLFLNTRQKIIMLITLFFSLIIILGVVIGIESRAIKLTQKFERSYWNFRTKILNYNKYSRSELSTRIRKSLYVEYINLTLKSHFMGAGPGQLVYSMREKPLSYTLYSVSSHSWLFEILCDYGIFIFLFYLLFNLYLIFNLLRLNDNLSKGLLCALLSFNIISFLYSTILNPVNFWVIALYSIALLYIKSFNSLKKINSLV